MQGKKSSDKILNQLLLPSSSHNRRLDRPGDLRVMQILSAFPSNKIQLLNGTIMIPIPPEDARALGLRVPGSENSSIGSSTPSSRSSAHSSTPSTRGKRLNNDVNKSSKDLKRQRNVDVNGTKRPPDSKQERKVQRTAASEKLSNFHAKLERGLRSISNRTKIRRKVDSETAKVIKLPCNLSPVPFSGTDGPSLGSSFRKNLSCQEEKSDKLGKESSSKSMRQLFSMADSWSNDSMISHSDSCACCHSREPCPLHRTDVHDGE